MSPKLETILIGVDLTAPSLEGAAWTARTFAPSARIVLAHALETRSILSFFSASEAARKTERVKSEVTARMEQLRAEFGADRVEIRFADGSPGVRLAELAGEVGADLIAIGAYREHTAGGLLGSVVSTLLGTATVPVLIAHAMPDHPPRRILAAVDHSKLTTRVLEWTRLLSTRLDATGTVLSAIEPPGIPVNTALFSSETEYAKMRDALVDRSRQALGVVMDRTGLDSAHFQREAVYGRPEAEIITAAERLGAELIVVGTRGHRHGQALMVGSVSRRVIEASICPVLVVPAAGEQAPKQDRTRELDVDDS